MSEEKKQLLKSIREKIDMGMKLAIERTWQEAKRNNYRMAIWQDGKAVIVNAAEVK